MKKHFYLIFMGFFLFSVLGLSECNSLGNVFDWTIAFMRYLSQSSEVLMDLSTQKIQSEVYSISVGENGKIMTRTGRLPADWIEIESGTTESLNFVKTHGYPNYSIACSVGDSGIVLYSRDRGQTWENISIPSLTQNLYGLRFIDYDYSINKALVIVCGDGGLVYRSYISTDTLWTWEQINTPTTQRLNSITSWLGLYLAVGDNGTIIRSTNFGQNWEDKSAGGANLNRIVIDEFQLAPTTAWIVGDSGKIYRTTDVGVSWELINSGTTENLYDLSFRSSYEGVVVGAKGVVKYTTNAGSSWNDDSLLSSITDKDIISIAGVDTATATALAISNYSQISRRSNINKASMKNADTTFIIDVTSKPSVGVDNEVSSIPSHFVLEQNYPNPFNPTTKITFAIPLLGGDERGGLVTLKIYDVLGNEVKTLINEENEAGYYSVNFNASDLPSGVYFYQLKAGTYVVTKKMVILK